MNNNIKLKKGVDLDNLREANRRLASILMEAKEIIKPGITTKEIDDFVYKKTIEGGDKPSYLGYQPFGAPFPYPGTVCVSVNDEVVHGIPGDRVIKEGDIVGIDGGLVHKGMYADCAVTVPVGEITDEKKKLLEVTRQALFSGIKACKSGNYVSDISKAIEKSIPKKYGVVKILSGHGVGYKPHEDPYVPNFNDGTRGPKLVPGMVLALEPMVNLGTDEVYLADDGYTFITADRKCSAHFEHSVLITESEPEILSGKLK